jgi:hypothetical protein
MATIGGIVDPITRRAPLSCDRMACSARTKSESAVMSDEDFIIPGESHNRLADGDDVEEMLEILIKIAQSEGRDSSPICCAWR